ncbi:reverse transcriptase domain-containing protein [Tanacetum coccineum]
MFRQTMSGLARNWFDRLDPKSVDGFEELSNKFLEEFSQLEKAESAHIKGVPPVLRISAFMHGHGHPELAKKLNDKIPKTVDKMWERVRAFIRGETAADTTEAIRSPQGEKSAEGFTPLTKTPKEILAVDNVNFPPPPPTAGTPEKRNMNKFCDYHQDRGHNTNDCYHLKKQLEEAVASGRLAHLVKDIRQGGQNSKGPAKREEKVIDMLMNCPVVVEVMIEGFRVRRIYVNGGSSSEVMYEHCFRNLSYRTRSRMRESRIPLVGFSREVSYPMRVIDLEVTMGEYEKTRTVIIEFAVVKSPSPYNALLVANPRVSLAPVETRSRRPGKEPMQLDDMEERRQLDKGKKPPKSGTKEKIVVNDNYPEQLVTIGGGLSAECRHALIHTLRKNVDIFPWTPTDITGILRVITEHSLDTDPHIEPKAQKKRSLALDMRKVVTDEVNEWLKTGIMIKKDEEKTAFHTEEGVFCYTKMPFGLKNAGATYQTLVDSAFKEQIRVNLEAYVDDMVITSRTEQDIIKDIEQTFSTF